jgi:hypothetical protein
LVDWTNFVDWDDLLVSPGSRICCIQLAWALAAFSSNAGGCSKRMPSVCIGATVKDVWLQILLVQVSEQSVVILEQIVVWGVCWEAR